MTSNERPRRRVLIVDDDEDNAILLSDILASRGFDTCYAHDGAVAVELARTFLPDAVLLDLGLPGMTGYEVASLLRSEHGEALLLIALTGSQEDLRRLELSGFRRHLLKPPDLTKLYTWLDDSSAA